MGQSASSDAEPTLTARPAVVLLGDSLTQYGFEPKGWASGLANYYGRRADVLNRGYSGYTSRWAVAAADSAFDCAGRDVILTTVWFGANDATVPGARQHVPVEEYARNLADLVRAAQRRSRVVVVMAPPPIADAKHAEFCKGCGKQCERNMDLARTYAVAAARVALETSAIFCDVFGAFERAADLPSLLNDGLHFTPAGQELVFETLKATIDAEGVVAVRPCPHTGSYHNSGSASTVPAHLPWHDGLNDQTYLAALRPPPTAQ